MVDFDKRKALKVLAGTAAIASVPSISAAGKVLSSIGSKDLTSTDEVTVVGVDGAELTAVLSMDTEPTIRISNHNGRTVDVRHVHPGIVHAGDKTFDINTIFKNGAVSIDAGSSREFSVGTTISTQAETPFPRHLYRHKPQRVVAVSGVNEYGSFVNSSRSFYS